MTQLSISTLTMASQVWVGSGPQCCLRKHDYDHKLNKETLCKFHTVLRDLCWLQVSMGAVFSCLGNICNAIASEILVLLLSSHNVQIVLHRALSDLPWHMLVAASCIVFSLGKILISSVVLLQFPMQSHILERNALHNIGKPDFSTLTRNFWMQMASLRSWAE